jgi:hypothetical protein
MLLITAAFGQFQTTPKSTAVAKPKSTPGKVLRPYIIKVKVDLGTIVAQDATVTLNILSTVLGPNVTDADREASKPTHYRWKYQGGGYRWDCKEGRPSGWSDWKQLQMNVKPSATLTGCKYDTECGKIKKGVCGTAYIFVQVKNAAGESNEKRASTPEISTEAEFCVKGEDLLKKFRGKVSGSLGSVCKVNEEYLKPYVQGVEAISWADQLYFSSQGGLTSGDSVLFLATGATPINGSKCEYELYGNATLPAGWSVVSSKTGCYALRGDIRKPGSYGCTMLKSPAPGTQVLTTKVRVWTDALKEQGVWAYFYNDYIIVKGYCRGLTGSNWPYMD